MGKHVYSPERTIINILSHSPVHLRIKTPGAVNRNPQVLTIKNFYQFPFTFLKASVSHTSSLPNPARNCSTRDRDNVVAEGELSQFSVRSQTVTRAKNHHMRKSESVDRNKIKLLIARKKRSGTKIEKANYNLV